MKRSPSSQSLGIRPRLNLAAINNAALAVLPSLLSRWAPGGAARVRIYRVDPTRDDRRPGSFSINLRTGCWADFALGDRDDSDMTGDHGKLRHDR